MLRSPAVLVVSSAIAICLLLAPAWGATPGSDTVMEFGAFLQAFTRALDQHYDPQLNPLKTRLAALEQQRDKDSAKAPESLIRQIGDVRERISKLTQERQKAADQAWRLFNCTKAVHDTLSQMEQKLNQADTWPNQIVWLDGIMGYQLAQARQVIADANKTLDYGQKLLAFKRLCDKWSQQAPTPHVKRMLNGMEGLFWIFEQFGDKVPTIGEFIKKYGEVGNALLGASERLHGRLERRTSGVLVEGRPNDGRLQAFDRQFPRLDRLTLNIWPMPGVRDAYAWPFGGVLVWDPQQKQWYSTGKYVNLPPDHHPSSRNMTPGDLLRRYAFLAAHGNVNPTPSDVFYDPSKIVALEMKAVPPIVPPKGQTSIAVMAETMGGDRNPQVLINLRIRPKGTLWQGLGFGSRTGALNPPLVEPNQVAIWAAPDSENDLYVITALLAQVEAEAGIRQAGTATCDVATGFATEMRVSADPDTVDPGGDGTVIVQIVNKDGDAVKAKGEIRAYRSHGVAVEDFKWSADGKATAPYHAPTAAGTYRVEVGFAGYVDVGFVLGKNATPCTGATDVVVKKKEEPPDEGKVVPDPFRELPEPKEEPKSDLPPLVRYKNPVWLIHVIEVGTMYGPQKRNAWVGAASKECPVKDGVYLDPDPYGAGVYICKVDRSQGPFSTNHEAGKAVADLGLSGIRVGSGHIDARPWLPKATK